MLPTIKYSVSAVFIFTCLNLITGCKKYLDLPLPTDKLAADGAYISDGAAGAVLTGILANASTNALYGSQGSNEAISFRTSQYADDLFLLNTSSSNSAFTSHLPFYADNVNPNNLNQWSALYKQIYLCNLAVEGVMGNIKNLAHNNQWLGEAYFFRAFSYLDLVGLYGDVPLTTSSSYLQNNVLTRSPKADVYKQIITDLKNAEPLLVDTGYVDGSSLPTPDRIRPNRWVAAALLARVYLYTGDWPDAEAEATKVIDAVSLYDLEAPASVFLANSRETLFALVPYSSSQSYGTETYVQDYRYYNAGAPSTIESVATLAGTYSMTPISNSLYNSFEPGDMRFANWIRAVTTTTTPANGVFYYPNKYKSTVPGTEFNVLFRFAEQYLIRAEARAQRNNLSGAQADINVIRSRAGLGVTTAATQTDLLAAVMQERRVELFTEWGHRFYDLKRTGIIDAVMAAAAAEKSANTYTNTQVSWSSYKQYWPIPPSDIQANPNLTQTPGY